ncbi:hypothetical protein pEaSNUABM54_00177 [Erwinia phage pEa_SNUABM_54]|nr:hypothetical protein pEaSNUABM54_00177 [Erwinia phage pEa_SNUABM_54]
MSNNNQSNYSHIAGGLYIVRTQAGFMSAIHHRLDALHQSTRPTEYHHNYPKTYPSLVSIDVGYRGYDCLEISCAHLNVVKEAIEKSEQQ